MTRREFDDEEMIAAFKRLHRVIFWQLMIILCLSGAVATHPFWHWFYGCTGGHFR